MLRYPKMPGPAGAQLGPCVAFEKLDGTNVFWEWVARRWTSFGLRSGGYLWTPEGIGEFRAKHAPQAAAPDVFAEALADPLAERLGTMAPAGRSVAFTELLGTGSFAGAHKLGDDMRLVLFDVWLDGHGFLGPERFLEAFGALPVPRVLFRGKFGGKLTEDVRAGKYGVAEGAVIKGGDGHTVWMAKVKTQAYLDRLKTSFGDRWEDYWE